MALPRGIRNHNPGNLRRSNDPWQGLAETQADPEFFTFTEPKWGIRALARVLVAYQDRHGLDTIRQIITRWAPPSENQTDAYVLSVSRRCEIDPDATINVQDYTCMRPLVEAIIWHENGQQPFTPAQIDAGLVLAGIEPPAKPLAQTRTAKGGQVAATGTAGTAAVEALADQAKDAVEPAASIFVKMAPYLGVAKWVFIALIIAGVGYMLWARFDDRRKGLR